MERQITKWNKFMIQTLYRPKRMRDGKRITSRLYSARIRIDGERRILNVSLGVADKDVAKEKVRKLVLEMEKELHGLISPKAMRNAAQEPLSKHLKDFIGDLRAKGRNQKYTTGFENQLTLLIRQCCWQSPKDVTADSFVKWRSGQKLAAKTLNEYLASAKGFCNWMTKQGRIIINPLTVVQNTETRGKEVRERRAYNDEEMKALLDVAGKHRILYIMASLTGIRHGEFKKLSWRDLNLNSGKPSVMVRASVGKNHKLACLPLHPALLVELKRYRPANASSGDLVFGKLVPRSELFSEHLKAAGIAKKDSTGRVVDFHSFRHTFCTYLHRAGVPLREAMELMRHSDARLTMKIYTDTSLFALQPAVENLPWNYLETDAQIDAQKTGLGGLLPSLPVTMGEGSEHCKTVTNTENKSLHVTLCHEGAELEKWCAVQGLNLRPLACEANALPLS
jgi:integrase